MALTIVVAQKIPPHCGPTTSLLPFTIQSSALHIPLYLILPFYNSSLSLSCDHPLLSRSMRHLPLRSKRPSSPRANSKLSLSAQSTASTGRSQRSLVSARVRLLTLADGKTKTFVSCIEPACSPRTKLQTRRLELLVWYRYVSTSIRYMRKLPLCTSVVCAACPG